MRAAHPRTHVGQRKAELFNERFELGALVAVRRVPGEPASWDRVFAPAYGWGDGAMVELASSRLPVDTDLVFALEPGLSIAQAANLHAEYHGDNAQAELLVAPARYSAWALACAFVLGAAAAVIFALAQPVKADVSAHPAEITSDSGETA